MKLIWSPQSLHDLTAVHADISEQDPKAARAVVPRIVSLVEEKLPGLPHIGRPGRVEVPRFVQHYGTEYITVELFLDLPGFGGLPLNPIRVDRICREDQ